MTLHKWFKHLKKKEGELIYDLETDFKNKWIKLAIQIFSELGSTVVMFLLFCATGIFAGLEAFNSLLTIYLFQLILIETIKFAVNRKRPATYKSGSPFGLGFVSGSFPSGHTSNVFCSAFLISQLFTTNIFYTSLLFTVAGLVGLARIFLGKHYLVDVAGGAILGVLFAIIGAYFYTAAFSLIR